jgi:2-dehydro-3-deoxygalactonokinase
MPDVMRGEETQVFGAAILAQAISGTYLLPGTHSKWVTLKYGKIFGLRTYMTGEIYAACRDHTILGRLMATDESDSASFARGVRDGARSGSPGALLNRLFGARTAGLFGEIGGASLADYLSGVLIGAEFADARQQDDQPLSIIASDALAERYLAAAAELGVGATTVVDPDCVTACYLHIAGLTGLLPAEGTAPPRSGA